MKNDFYNILPHLGLSRDSSEKIYLKVSLLHDGGSFENRQKRIQFHVECEDYFANLATILDLITQDQDIFKDKRFIKILKNIRDDLMYLQKNFVIERKWKISNLEKK